MTKTIEDYPPSLTTKVNIYLISDTHLEFNRNPPQKDLSKKEGEINVLLIAGDIGHPNKHEYRDFLVTMTRYYDHVIFVAGNHEYYGQGKNGQRLNVDEVEANLRRLAKETDCFFLQRESYSLPVNGETKITFLGTTLWSHLDPSEYTTAEKGLNDFRMIRSDDKLLTPQLYSEWHQRDLSWLKKEIRKRHHEKVIVITHHLPTYQLIHPLYRDSNVNMCFASHLDQLIAPPLILWACGHTHKAKEIQIHHSLASDSSQVETTYLAVNPVGYPGENKGVQAKLVMSLRV